MQNFLQDVRHSGKLELTGDDREVYSYSKKHTVYKEDQRPRAVYFIVSGKVKIFRINDDGKELITSIHHEGDYFGYTQILEESVYKENAAVLEDAKLMLIPRDDFRQLVSNDLEIARAFIKIITRNISEKEDSLLNLAYSTLRKKVAFGLVQLLEKYKTEEDDKVILNLSRENMAQTIGIATELLIRTLGDFKDEKLIDIQNGKVVIRDEKKLKMLPY